MNPWDSPCQSALPQPAKPKPCRKPKPHLAQSPTQTSKHLRHLLSSKLIRFPLTFRQNLSLSYSHCNFTLIGATSYPACFCSRTLVQAPCGSREYRSRGQDKGTTAIDSNMKQTVPSSLKVFSRPEMEQGLAGLLFDLNSGWAWREFTQGEDGFVQSLMQAAVVRFAHTFCRVLMLFADGRMLVLDFEEVAKDGENRDFEVFGVWKVNKVLRTSQSVIEFYKNDGAKVKKREQGTLEEYFHKTDEDNKKTNPMISSFSIVHQNSPEDPWKIEFALTIDNLIILWSWNEELFICPKIIQLNCDKIMHLACFKSNSDLLLTCVSANPACVHLVMLSTFESSENSVSNIEINSVDAFKLDLQGADFDSEMAGICLVKMQQTAKYLLAHSGNVIHVFEIRPHSKSWELSKSSEECKCDPDGYSKSFRLHKVSSLEITDDDLMEWDEQSLIYDSVKIKEATYYSYSPDNEQNCSFYISTDKNVIVWMTMASLLDTSIQKISLSNHWTSGGIYVISADPLVYTYECSQCTDIKGIVGNAFGVYALCTTTPEQCFLANLSLTPFDAWPPISEDNAYFQEFKILCTLLSVEISEIIRENLLTHETWVWMKFCSLLLYSMTSPLFEHFGQYADKEIDQTVKQEEPTDWLPTFQRAFANCYVSKDADAISLTDFDLSKTYARYLPTLQSLPPSALPSTMQSLLTDPTSFPLVFPAKSTC